MNIPSSKALSKKDATLYSQLKEDWPRARLLLERLVRTNSHTLNKVGVEHNSQILEEEFAPLGFIAHRKASYDPRYGAHLLLDNGAPGPPILLVSHLDTVYSQKEQLESFKSFEEKNGTLIGPGTIDIKGGSVLMNMLVRAWEANSQDFCLPPVRWILAWNASEEHLTADFSRWVAKVVPSTTLACLVFEADNRKSTGHELVTSRKGMARWTIEVRGRSVHSGNAHAHGLNAITRLAELVTEISSFTDYSRDLTVNVGIIQGGISTNRVPDSASASFEMRYINPGDYETLKSRLLEKADSGCFVGPQATQRCEVILRPEQEIDSWPGGEDTARLADIWRTAAESCSLELGTGRRGGLSDANYLHRIFPTLDGLGPRGGNAHTVESKHGHLAITEYVESDSFLSKGLVNFLAIRDLLEQTSSMASVSLPPGGAQT